MPTLESCSMPSLVTSLPLCLGRAAARCMPLAKFMHPRSSHGVPHCTAHTSRSERALHAYTLHCTLQGTGSQPNAHILHCGCAHMSRRTHDLRPRLTLHMQHGRMPLTLYLTACTSHAWCTVSHALCTAAHFRCTPALQEQAAHTARTMCAHLMPCTMHSPSPRLHVPLL